MKGYIGLTRFSPRPGDVVRWSEDNQVADIEAWAAKQNEPIVAWRHSRFESGDKSDRFDLPEILDALKGHSAQGIVCADLSRWSRLDVPGFFAELQRVTSAGYEVRWVAEDWLDLKKPYAWSILGMIVERNNLELETIRRKSSAGVRRAQSNGIWVGKIPWGWARQHSLGEREDRKLQPGVDYGIKPNHRLRAKMLRIFALRAERHSWHDIERREGVDAETVRSVIKQERNREIVGDDLWERTQLPGYVERVDSRGYLLTSLVICPWCDKRMIGQASKTWEMAHGLDGASKRPRYICRTSTGSHPWRSISERLITRHLWPVLDAMALSPADQAEIAERVGRTDKSAAAQQKLRLKTLMKIETRRRRIEEGVASGLIRLTSAKDMLSQLDAEERDVPPPPIQHATVAADLVLLASIGSLVRAVDWPNDRQGVRMANALLREVLVRIEWPDKATKYRPRIVLNDRYAAIWAAISGRSSSSTVARRA
jgi:DNA invertase Pin-like site-specific DNA recombinase